MAELTISINSRPFAIACADGEEQRVSRLAEDLAARLGEVKKNVSGAGDSVRRHFRASRGFTPRRGRLVGGRFLIHRTREVARVAVRQEPVITREGPSIYIPGFAR